MLFLALGMTTAVWLLAAPLLGLETGVRAEVAIAVGIGAAILAPLGLWFRSARIGLVALGMVLGFGNFALTAPMGALASLATCAIGLIAAGTAPGPMSVPEATTELAGPFKVVAWGRRTKTPPRLHAAA